MRRRFVPGAYVPGSTPFHRIDPRVKMALLLVASIISFAASAPLGLVVVLLGLVAAVAMSGVSAGAILAGVRPAALVLLLSILANAVVLVGQPGVSLAGLLRGATAALRIVCVVGFALALSSTTLSTQMTDALASLLSPLSRVGVPVGGMASSASIALRFIPLTVEEVDRIRCAQRARGARLDEGGALVRLRGWGQVLVPLIVSLLRRADELGAAMADRCYTGDQTPLVGPFAPRDWAALGVGVLWAVVALVA